MNQQSTEKASSSKTGARILHIHPTLNCNLKCAHCYSSSAPGLKSSLPAEDIIRFLPYAKSYGFNTVSISGGEPFLYRNLKEILKEARSLEMRTLMASNGMLLGSQRAQEILDYVDVIAISIDGGEAIHDQIRGQKGAFAKMMTGVEVLRKREQLFGFIHTLTPHAWKDLLSICVLALKNGAKLLQLHPLEIYGRATESFCGETVDQNFLHRAYIMGNVLKVKHADHLKVQLDFLHSDTIINNPSLISYYGEDFRINEINFAQVIQSLIIDEKGNLVPVAYGFNPQLNIGNIKEIEFGLDPIKDYIERKGRDLYGLLSRCHSSISSGPEEMVAWSEMVVRQSYDYSDTTKFQELQGV